MQIPQKNRLEELREIFGNRAGMTRNSITPMGRVISGAIVPAALYGANALASGGTERWDRTAENTVGNLAGATAGVYLGQGFGLPGVIAGGVVGALGGGYASDRIADAFDPTMGMNNEALAMQAEEKKQAALSLLNQYLDPRAQAALERKLAEQQMMTAQYQQ